MEVYNQVFPWAVTLLGTFAAFCLVAGGVYAAFVFATATPDPNRYESKGGNVYAGTWIMVGSILAAMVCLWLTKQILVHS